MDFPRLDVAHSSFPHAPLLMTGCSRAPLGLLWAPFLANLTSLSWGTAFLDVPSCGSCGSQKLGWKLICVIDDAEQLRVGIIKKLANSLDYYRI